MRYDIYMAFGAKGLRRNVQPLLQHAVSDPPHFNIQTALQIFTKLGNNVMPYYAIQPHTL